jgi:phage shock protein PspC (stress-responsive transcriptional regulator)
MSENQSDYGSQHSSGSGGTTTGTEAPNLTKDPVTGSGTSMGAGAGTRAAGAGTGTAPGTGTATGTGTGTGTEAWSGTGPPERKLERTADGRIIGGVCSGFGRYFGIDANIIRVLLVVVTVFGGAGVLAYALAWLLIPEEGKPTSMVQDLINKQQRPPT